MSNLNSIGPTQRRALLAALQSPAKCLTRSTGGWWIAIGTGCNAPVFTLRTVRMLDRAWLLDMSDEFATSARLTAKGTTLALQLQAANQRQAGAA